MSADGRLQDVDERGRQAAVALRRSVAAVHPGKDLAQRGTWARPVLAIGVLVAVGAVVAVIAFTAGFGGDDDESTLVTDSPPEVRPMAPTEVPDGLELNSAVQLGESPDFDPAAVPDIATVIYGVPSGEDPFAGGDLLVTTINFEDVPDDPAAPSALLETEQLMAADPGSEEVPLRGHVGYRSEAMSYSASAESLSWMEGDTLVQVLSQQLEFDQMVAVAEDLDVSDVSFPEAQWLPSGLEQLAVFEGLPTDPEIPPLKASGSYYVEYTTSRDSSHGGYGREGALLRVSTSEADEGSLLGIRWLAGEALEMTEVRGQEALLMDRSGMDHIPDSDYRNTTVSWIEGDGVLVSVSSLGLGMEELLAVVESLEPLDEEAWEEFRRESWGGRVTEVASGEHDGREWHLTLREGQSLGELQDLSVCFEYRGLSCGPLGSGRIDGGVDQGVSELRWGFDGTLLHGRTHLEAAYVAVEIDGEEIGRAETIADPQGRGVAYFVVAAPELAPDAGAEPDVGGELRSDVVAYGADGEEIDRATGP